MGSVYLRHGDLRLDGRFYSEEAWLARLLVQESVLGQEPLGGANGLADVWMPARFKRVEVREPRLGVPFVTPSEIIQAKPSLERYISKARTKKLESYIVDSNWILVSRSGVVGRVVMTSKGLQGVAVSEDAIRVIAREGVLHGYLYAYLNSFIGQNLVSKDQYGGVIKHIEPFHLATLPVPLVPPILQRRIHEDITEAYRLRDEANDLLDEADETLYRQLRLPRIADTVDLYRSRDVKAFAASSSEMDLRLDASHYNPQSRRVIRLLKQREDVLCLEDVTERIFHPFRVNMVLVEKKYGVPFLGGGDISRFRYVGDKFISPITKSYDTYLLRRGWTLMTIGGTIGRMAYVGSEYDGWAASQHVTRIVPNRTEVCPGYLYAFMASEYGRLQVETLIYGAVVDTIRENQLEMLCIPVPPKTMQKAIHEKVEAAYENRASANRLEAAAIKVLEDTAVEAYRKRTGGQVAVR